MFSARSSFRRLQSRGRDLHRTDGEGNGLLHRAVLELDAELIAELLACGLDPLLPNGWGMTPVDYARWLNARSCLLALQVLEKKPTVTFRPAQAQETLRLSPREFREYTGVTYVSHPFFDSARHLRKALNQCLKIQQRGWLDEEMLWLGALFSREIEERAEIAYEIRWISEAIGYGLYTSESLAQGRYVGEYVGEVKKRSWWNVFRNSEYCFRYPTTHWCKPAFTVNAQMFGNYTRFINHSSKPNLECAAVFHRQLFRLVFRVIRPIEPGEQLTYDYGPEYWRHREAPLDPIPNMTQKLDG